MQKILIIQTAFIGDVVLATALIEQCAAHYPDAKIDFLLRKGNEGLLKGHPLLNEVLIWNKKQQKYANLFRLLGQIRKRKYDVVVNLQRFFSTGLLTAFSGAKHRLGFQKNPLAFGFSQAFPHAFGTKDQPIHEVHRNLQLIEALTNADFVKPKLYVPDQIPVDIPDGQSYICIAPTSVWFTKQWPGEKWVTLLNRLPNDHHIYLLGGPTDREACAVLIEQSTHPKLMNMAGKLSLLESAALMRNAQMNYVNDSAPLHFASATNAPVTAIFCSTIPDFGFYPLSTQSFVAETEEQLDCRPCGLHGKKACPEGHFKCSNIDLETLLRPLSKSDAS